MKTFTVSVTLDNGKAWGTTFNVTEKAAEGQTDKLLALKALDSLITKMEDEVIEDTKDSIPVL